ncbi:MAG TPA: geranylgeranyl reductase family protein [Bryobacteraceae bacterium]|nr:geranylgeranyl reductase family protein [Bryobacteraceae bacterium]
MNDRLYDVCIAGAGPAGSTCAFYLARAGVRVLLLDRERFPRDKICGDAVCSPAHEHLRRMGVLQQIEAAGLGHWAAVGGLCSPKGIAFIGSSVDRTKPPLVIAIRRIVLDEKMVRAAQRAGANLVEEYPAGGLEFSRSEGVWTIRHARNGAPPFRARVLVAADGSPSRIARSLGMVTTRPQAVCSRAYVEAGSTGFEADGLVYYPPELLPGYCALFREAGGLLNFCAYILPGGGCANADLRRMHEHLLRDDPHLRKVLGSRAHISKMQGAELRLGGIARSAADHLLIVGDAAGQIDPFTGEGIHHAIEAASIAAEVIAEGLRANDLSAAFLSCYHFRWQAAFGRDFRWSARMARICARHPWLLDAAASLVRRRGTDFLRDWAEMMTGARPKSSYLRPNIAFTMMRELARQWVA